jgi:drug/metabolite transporter (DMT)-like permease
MKLRGIAYTVISSVFFGILPIFVKFALNTGLKTNQIILIRFSFAALFLFLYLLPQKKDLQVSIKQFLVLIFCAVVGYMGMNLTLFIAYQMLGAGLATAIHFSYPLFVTIFSALLYKEHLNPAKKTALLLSVGGVGYLLPPFHSSPYPLGWTAEPSGVHPIYYLNQIHKRGCPIWIMIFGLQLLQNNTTLPL